MASLKTVICIDLKLTLYGTWMRSLDRLDVNEVISVGFWSFVVSSIGLIAGKPSSSFTNAMQPSRNRNDIWNVLSNVYIMLVGSITSWKYGIGLPPFFR